MAILDYHIGAPFHFEMVMKTGNDEMDEVIMMINNGEPDLITIDGSILYNDGKYAIVLVTSRNEEFADQMLTFDEVCSISPKFAQLFEENKYWPGHEFVCVEVENGDFVWKE
jgi:hypothetical protein